MIEGFENALDSFIERQERIDEIRAEISGINGQRNTRLDTIDQAIAAIKQHISDRDNLHREELPPEAFQGYGGQTPQYEDDWIYGPTKQEKDELNKLFEERRKILKELGDAEIPLL